MIIVLRNYSSDNLALIEWVNKIFLLVTWPFWWKQVGYFSRKKFTQKKTGDGKFFWQLFKISPRRKKSHSTLKKIRANGTKKFWWCWLVFTLHDSCQAILRWIPMVHKCIVMERLSKNLQLPWQLALFSRTSCRQINKIPFFAPNISLKTMFSCCKDFLEISSRSHKSIARAFFHFWELIPSYCRN